jgi:dienelactone hydrolase
MTGSGTIVRMASLALFHSIHGLRPAVHDMADRFRAHGHRVVTPDLYAAPPAGTIEEGRALAEPIGWDTMLGRAREAVRELPPDAVLAGLSMGTGVVRALLAERPQTAGLLLISGTGGSYTEVPAGLRAQLHVADPDDEYAPAADVHRWTAEMTGAHAAFEVFRYPDVGHLWTDRECPDHDAPAAELAWQRCAEFLRLS